MNWKKCEEAVPRSAVQMIPFDAAEQVLLMHRSDKVRSARNVWSFPSGMHEIGNTLEAEAFRELKEEYDLTGLRSSLLGVYENIGGDPEPGAEQYHWVISVLAVEVVDVTMAVNREPDKHDKMEFTTIGELRRLSFEKYPFHQSFQEWFYPLRGRSANKMLEILDL